MLRHLKTLERKPMTLDNYRSTLRAQMLPTFSDATTVAPHVTKKLDMFIVADPNSLSGKARKAREYGVRIVAEVAFWSMIGHLRMPLARRRAGSWPDPLKSVRPV